MIEPNDSLKILPSFKDVLFSIHEEVESSPPTSVVASKVSYLGKMSKLNALKAFGI